MGAETARLDGARVQKARALFRKHGGVLRMAACSCLQAAKQFLG